MSQEGFKYSLATGTHGGVLVAGDIRQEAVINLVALRTLTDDLNLKRYLLGLALVALSYRDQQCFNLREGCLLRGELGGLRWQVEVRELQRHGCAATIDHDIAVAYAQSTVRAMTIETPEPDTFDTATAEAWLKIDKKKRKTLAKTKHPATAVAGEAAVSKQSAGKGSDSVPNNKASQ